MDGNNLSKKKNGRERRRGRAAADVAGLLGLCTHAAAKTACSLQVNLVVVWAEPGFSGLVLLFGLNWFGV